MALTGSLVREAADSLRLVLGLGRRGRLREHLDHTIQIFEKIEPYKDLVGARIHIIAAIESQARQLSDAANPDLRRHLQWGQFAIILIFLAGPLAALTWWGVQMTDHWWGWVWTVFAGASAVLLTIAAFGVLVTKSDD